MTSANPSDAPFCAGPDPNPRKPQLRLPALACDCHAHVCGPAARYPYWPGRVYTPPDCLPSAYRRMLATLGVERAVLVQPSVYWTDNRAMLDAMQEAGAAFRGVAVVDESIGDAQIDRLHAAGVRGLRCNIVDIAQDKARTSALFRVPSKSYMDRLANGETFILRLTGATPVAGGMPIVVGGKLIGAIGLSGATSAQDHQVAQAGASAVK